jgi:hypothetical protein
MEAHATWEPQIRTNLGDEAYRDLLDSVLSRVPGSLSVGIVNTRFRETCLRLPGRVDAGPAALQAMVALVVGFFGQEPEPPPGFAEAVAALRPVESAYLGFREETLLVRRITGREAVLVLMVPASLNQGASLALLNGSAARLDPPPPGGVAAVLERSIDALAGMVLDLGSGQVVERYDRFQGASVLSVDDGLTRLLMGLFMPQARPSGLRLRYTSGDAVSVQRAELVTATRSLHWSRVPFDPEHVLVLLADRQAVRGLIWNAMRRSETETVRLWVDGLLNYGVKSTMSPFPETQAEFLSIVKDLRQLHPNDLLGRLDIGGFANHAVGEGEDLQRCQECIYYLPNGRWCDLPELPIPVEAHWWCRLWKM